MRRPGESSEVGFEPIDPSPQSDELPSKRGVGPVGGVTSEDRIDRSVQEGRVVRIDRQIVEYSNHKKVRTFRGSLTSGLRKISVQPTCDGTYRRKWLAKVSTCSRPPAGQPQTR